MFTMHCPKGILAASTLGSTTGKGRLTVLCETKWNEMIRFVLFHLVSQVQSAEKDCNGQRVYFSPLIPQQEAQPGRITIAYAVRKS